MHSDALHALISILVAVMGVAMLAVILSKQANTPSVLTSFGTSFSQILGTALSPITGGGASGTSTGLVGLTPLTQVTP